MVNTASTFYALSPTYRPVGGVIKIFDYALHARARGLPVVICVPEEYRANLPIFDVPGLAALRASEQVSYRSDFRIGPGAQDYVFFSWPAHFTHIEPRLRGGPDGMALARVLHIVQNVRHANPQWAGGYPLRLLTRPLTRVVINEQVRAAIAPYLNERCATHVVPLGHRAEHFAMQRHGPAPDVLKVAYTTWKSDVGVSVEDELRSEHGFAFRSIRETVSWEPLRELYQWCDVFLGTPGPEEGFYLPGLEAMAAGAVVIISDAGGNRAYCDFGRNCLQVPFEEAAGYVDALRALADGRADFERLREAGYQEAGRHSLDAERDAFHAVLDSLDADPRVVDPHATAQHSAARAVGEPATAGRDVVLTGLPRSGTTLATHLLNRLDDTVALSEPLAPSEYQPLGSRLEVLAAITDFFTQQREELLEHGRAVSKNLAGRDTDNYFQASTEDGLRKDLAERNEWQVGKELSGRFTLVVKDLATCTALLPELCRRFPCFAVVRNPLAVLGSWETVDVPFREGRSPHAEWFDSDLGRHQRADGNRFDRQLRLLDWWCERLLTNLDDRSIIRYEELIASDGRALTRIAPAAAELTETLQSRNVNDAYDRDTMLRLSERLLAADGAFFQLYPRASVERLAAELEDRTPTTQHRGDPAS